MNKLEINWPEYNAEKAQVLSQHKFALYKAKIALGVVPVDKFDADGSAITTPCWEWQACKGKDGYGQFGFTAGKMGSAHRISAFLAGIVPSIISQSKNDLALHRCDNPACINPAHLFKGSDDDNSRDKMEKNRQSRLKGEANGRAKLTWEQVNEIRTRYASCGITTVKLANEYGQSDVNIGQIVHNELWHDESYVSPAKQTRLNQEQRAEVVELYAQGGKTMQKLAEQYNVSRHAISNIIRNDTEYTPPQTRLSKEQRAEVIKLYSTGDTSTRKLAKQFGVNPSTICNILKGK